MMYSKDYLTVKQRKKLFREDHPDGRIQVQLVNDNLLDYAVVKAVVYKDGKDQMAQLPLGEGHAFEFRDTEIKISNKGKEYESVNFSSWVENCEESAVGRALDNAGYAGNDSCSREEVDKAERNRTKSIYFLIDDKIKEARVKPELDAVVELINRNKGQLSDQEVNALRAKYKMALGELA